MSNKHTKEFKREAIRLALTSSQPIAQTAQDLGLKESSLYHWVRQAKDTLSSETGASGELNLMEELSCLRKENAR